MVELLPSVMEDLISVNLEKLSTYSELFSNLAYHRIMKGFSCFDMATRENPRSMRCMLYEEDLTF